MTTIFRLLGLVIIIIGSIFLGTRIERHLAHFFYLDLIKSVLHCQALVVEPLVSNENYSQYKAIEHKLQSIIEDDGLDLPNKLAVASNYLNDLKKSPNKPEATKQ